MAESLRAELEKYLDALNIRTSCVEHPPVNPKPSALLRFKEGRFLRMVPGLLGSFTASWLQKSSRLSFRHVGRGATSPADWCCFMSVFNKSGFIGESGPVCCWSRSSACGSGVHGGGDDAPPPGPERRRHQEPLPEGQEEEEPVVGVGPPRPPGQQSLDPRPPTPDVSSLPSLGPPQVNLNHLAKKLGVGSGNLRFSDEATMLETLKVGKDGRRAGSEAPPWEKL